MPITQDKMKVLIKYTKRAETDILSTLPLTASVQPSPNILGDCHSQRKTNCVIPPIPAESYFTLVNSVSRTPLFATILASWHKDTPSSLRHLHVAVRWEDGCHPTAHRAGGPR